LHLLTTMNNDQNRKSKLNICRIQNAIGLLNRKCKIPCQNFSFPNICIRYGTSIWFCKECKNYYNLLTNKKYTNRYKYRYYSLRTNYINEIINIEGSKENKEFTDNTYFNNLSNELDTLSSLMI